mgnify:CR=1 FL=1
MNHTQTNTSKNQAEISSQGEISREGTSEESAKDILQAEKDSPKVQESQDVEIKILKGEETSPQDTKGMDTFTIQNLNFNVNYGFGGFVKMGQHFRIQCKISNLG